MERYGDVNILPIRAPLQHIGVHHTSLVAYILQPLQAQTLLRPEMMAIIDCANCYRSVILHILRQRAEVTTASIVQNFDLNTVLYLGSCSPANNYRKTKLKGFNCV